MSSVTAHPIKVVKNTGYRWLQGCIRDALQPYIVLAMLLLEVLNMVPEVLNTDMLCTYCVWLGLFLVPLHSIVNEWMAMVVESPVRNLIRFRSCLKRICHRQTTLKGIRNFDNFSKTFLNHSLKWKALQCIVDCNVFFLGACELLYIICILINRYDRFWGNILQ